MGTCGSGFATSIRTLGPPPGRSMCQQADKFAASALMQPYWFSLIAEASRFNVVAPQRTYGRANSSLSIRLVEVMRHQLFLAVLYDQKEEGDPHEWSVQRRRSSSLRSWQGRPG